MTTEGFVVQDAGSISISTTSPLEGLASLRFTPPGANAGRWRTDWSSADVDTALWVRFYYRTAAFPTGADVEMATIANVAVTQYVNLKLASGGIVNVYDAGSGVRDATTVALVVDTTYRFEYKLTLVTGAGADTFDCNIYQGDSLTVYDTLSYSAAFSNAGFAKLYLGASGGSPGFSGYDCYYDSVAINDGVGSVDNTWPGPRSPLTPARWDSSRFPKPVLRRAA